MIDDSDGINTYMDSIPWNDPTNVVPFPGDKANLSEAPTITLQAGELHNIATEAETALMRSGAPFYVRGEKIVKPVAEDMPSSNGGTTRVARLAEVSEASMIDFMSRSAVWLKWDARSKKHVSADPTPKIAATLLSRDGEWRFPKLSGVVTTPTLRPDGTILSQPGYDHATRLLLIDPPEMPKIPSRPSKKGAQDALRFLDALLDEFPFVDEASRSVALSALITPVVRGAVPVTPMHVTRAPVAGSGKSYIIDLASAINSGERAPVLSAGKTEEEMEKRLVGAMLAGQTFISLDNVNGELSGDFLCQLVERPIISVRPLGQSKPVKIESRASCFATGNNIRLVGDMTRRVLMCSLDPGVERPELREFHDNPFDKVLADRGRYIAAALIVVRAYVAAGCPGQLPALASFEAWSKLVRSALVWLGRPDPVLTMEAAREEDPVTANLRQFLKAWHSTFGEIPHTGAEAINAANEHNPHGGRVNVALFDIMSEVGSDRMGVLKPKILAKYLSAHKNRVLADLRITDKGKDRNDSILWRVVKV